MKARPLPFQSPDPIATSGRTVTRPHRCWVEVEDVKVARSIANKEVSIIAIQ